MGEGKESGGCLLPLARSAPLVRITARGRPSDRPTLQALLGGMSPKMIEKYSHVRAEAKRRVVAVFYQSDGGLLGEVEGQETSAPLPST